MKTQLLNLCRPARSGRRPRPEHQERQLLKIAEYGGYYVRLFYLVENDSFYLEWLLPSLGATVAKVGGNKHYTSPEDCAYSWRYCVNELREHSRGEFTGNALAVVLNGGIKFCVAET